MPLIPTVSQIIPVQVKRKSKMTSTRVKVKQSLYRPGVAQRVPGS
jgi:hypothetical protein